MSVLIKGMEMPKSCMDCQCFCEENFYCRVKEGDDIGLGKRPKDCPLFPVPTHGRLGDLNLLAERLEDLRKTTAKENPPTDNHGFNNGIMCGIGAAITEVRYYTPTIIQADKEGEG